MSFCENLKKARQRIGLTQQQIANALGITKSTYCGYETGKRQPDIPKLRRLALLLCVSVDELLGLVGGESEYIVSPAEFEQIKLYRALDAHGQRVIRLILEEENTRVHTSMCEDTLVTAKEDGVSLRIALHPISCENSVYLGPDGFQTVLVKKDALPPGAAFALRVRGSSLMPHFHDHDILIVSDSKPQSGEIGVFMRNEYGFVRLTGYSELLSINPAYLPMPLDDSIRPCGTVIGVLSPSDIL